MVLVLRHTSKAVQVLTIVQKITHIDQSLGREPYTRDADAFIVDVAREPSDNRLAPSRGVIIGLLISAALWIVIVLVIWLIRS